MHIMSTNFAKTLVWKHESDVKLTSQAAHTKRKWAHANETSPWKFSAYATALSGLCRIFL